MTTARWRSAVLTTIAVALVVTACGDDADTGDTLQTVDPATPATAPPAVDPAGSVIPVTGTVDAVVAVPGTDLVAVLVDGTRVLVGTPDSVATAPPLTLGSRAATLVAGDDGEVLAPADGEVSRIDARSGALDRVVVDGDAVSATVTSDGGLAVGTTAGTVHLIAPDGSERTVGGFASVDALVAVGDDLAALDRRQSSVTEISVPEARAGLALRTGQGGARMTVDDRGRIFATDARTEELLVYTLDSLVLRQRYPVPGAYAVTSDDTLVWVASASTNAVFGYDVSTGIPIERARYATVRQPTTVAYDRTTDALVVGSGSGDGLQRIPIAR